jgi:predicted restriction endonuclease
MSRLNAIRKNKQTLCVICNSPTENRHSYCRKHSFTNSIDNLTLKEAVYKNQQPANNYARIRGNARRLAKQFTKKCNLKYVCLICGYDKFVHVCHIKDIKDFQETTTIREINALSNLTLLCPNHHKELDTNILDTTPPSLAELLEL